MANFNVPRDWLETNSRHQKRYSEGGRKIRECRGLLGRVIPKDFLTFFIKRLIKVCAVPWNLQNLKLQNSTQRAPQRVLTCYAKRRIRR